MFEKEPPDSSLEHLRQQWDEEEKAAEMPKLRGGFHGTPDHVDQPIPAEASVEATERKFLLRPGDSVRVRRGSGVVDEGWVVHEIYMDGYYRVIKDTGEKEVLEKFVPWDELEALNPGGE